MRLILASMLAFAWISWMSAGNARAAEETWTGQISDTLCAASHKAMAEQVGYTDRQCTIECVKSGGKYILVTEGKVLQITNQDFAALEDHAAHTVKVTGEKKADAIVISKIEMVSPKSN